MRREIILRLTQLALLSWLTPHHKFYQAPTIGVFFILPNSGIPDYFLLLCFCIFFFLISFFFLRCLVLYFGNRIENLFRFFSLLVFEIAFKRNVHGYVCYFRSSGCWRRSFSFRWASSWPLSIVKIFTRVYTGERRGWIFIIFRRNEVSNENLSTWWKQNIYKLINNDNYFECESQIDRSR